MNNRGYQRRFSESHNSMFSVENRKRKAVTMVCVFTEHLGNTLKSKSLLNIGGSTGIIDEYLSNYFKNVTSIDIDEPAINHAARQYNKENLNFEVGDAMDIHYPDNHFDTVVCSQVYEHVPDVNKLASEMYRVLKPGGIAYFAAGNRIMLNEPHYNLPLLSVIPRTLAHIYLKILGRGNHYYEKHLTYWQLKKTFQHIMIFDYTLPIIEDPERYHAEYMIQPKSKKQMVAKIIAKYCNWLSPGYIWIMQKLP